MRIVHLSDLHASADRDFDQRRIAKALLEDIRAEHEQVPVDLVIFSGDLANGGTEGEFLIGHELIIEPLLASLDLPLDHLVIVPGNHDVERPRINTFEDDGLRAQLTTEEAVTKVLSSPDAVRRLNERFSSWLEYRDMLPSSNTFGGLATVHRFELKGCKVGAVALNSSWRSAGDLDERHLLIGEYQLATALDEVDDSDFLLAVAHHPLDWLDRFDESAIRRELEHRNVMYLCGHLHEPEPSDEIRRGHVIYSRAGCLYEDTRYLNGYSLIDISTDGSVSINMRTWWPDRGVFDIATNIAKDGVFTTNWPKSNLTGPLPTGVDVLASLADIVQQSSFLDIPTKSSNEPALDDLLVEPRLLPLPYKEALAAKRVNDKFSVEPIIPWDSNWLGAHIILIAGEPEAGVSSALLWLLADRYTTLTDLLPTYVPFDDRFSERGLAIALEKSARLAGWTGTRGELPPMLIAFDDVVGSGRGLETIVAFLKQHPEHHCLLGCRQYDHNSLAKFLTDVSMEYSSYFLGPFGRQQLRTLVEKIAGHGSSEIIDHIFAVVDAQDLPRTPFILTALVAVMVSINPSDIDTLEPSDLLQAFTTLLLSRDDIGGTDRWGMNYRRREYLLGSFAQALTHRNSESMKRLDAEEYLSGWFKSKGWGPGASPGRVLDSLIDRKILAEDSAKKVGFRQPALRHLFTAKWMLEDDDFRAFILSDPLAYPDAVRHAASLQRSSRTLLVATHNAARDVISTRLDDSARFDDVVSQAGWSGFMPNPKELERALENEGERIAPNTRERDAKLDALYEESAVTLDDDGGRLLPVEYEQLVEAVRVLTWVLSSSELVDDVTLKKDVLRTAIQGWGLLAGYASATGDASALRKYLIRETELGSSEEKLDELERMIRLLIVVAMLMDVESDLGTAQLGTIVDDMISDVELMDETASALFMTLLYFAGHHGEAVQRLRDLYEAHQDHPIIVGVVRAWTHWAYDHEDKVDLRNRLESLLVDIFVGTGTPPTGQARTAQRNGIAKNLRALRLKRLAQGRQIDGAGLDVLDTADPVPDDGIAS
jgi:3',5'-cyclic AMP phosphodiesterase CpdA